MSEKHCTHTTNDNFREDYACAHGYQIWLLVNPEQLVCDPKTPLENTQKAAHNNIKPWKKKEKAAEQKDSIHTSCSTENSRAFCSLHSPSQKFYTTQLFLRLSIMSKSWRQDSQSQASLEKCILSDVRGRKKSLYNHFLSCNQSSNRFIYFQVWHKNSCRKPGAHHHAQNQQHKYISIYIDVYWPSGLYLFVITKIICV